MTPTGNIPRSSARILIAQAVLTLAVAMAALWRSGLWADAVAALYGGAIVVIGNAWMIRRIRRAAQLAMQDGQAARDAGAARAAGPESSEMDGDAAAGNTGRAMTVLISGWLQRFVLAAVALALGLGPLALPPGPMITAFAIAQAGYLFAGDDTPATRPETR